MAKGEVLLGFRVDETPNLRGQRGQFTSDGMRELRQRNIAMGEILRSQLGRRIENKIAFHGRAAASTGRLLAVSVSSRNQHVDNWNVGVGLIDYLNRSSAKYWRTFEEGSAAVWRRPFVGTQLVSIYRRQGPSPSWTNLRTAGPGIAFRNQGARQMFIVRQEIAPAHAYRGLAEQANLALYGLQGARRFLDRVFNTPLKIFQPKT